MGQSATKEVGSQKYTSDRKTLYNKSFSITVKDIQIFKGTIILQKCCLKMKIGLKKHRYTTAVLGNLQ